MAWKRQLYRRLVVPLIRGQHAPEYTARGTMIGLGFAFTPLVGAQMPIVAAIWFIWWTWARASIQQLRDAMDGKR